MNNRFGLKLRYDEDNKDIIEIGVDEVGRGFMFGRVYVCAVALRPQQPNTHDLPIETLQLQTQQNQTPILPPYLDVMLKKLSKNDQLSVLNGLIADNHPSSKELALYKTVLERSAVKQQHQDQSNPFMDVRDSKLIKSHPKRCALAQTIKSSVLAYAVEYESETVVDEINILQANVQAMKRAIQNVITQILAMPEYEHHDLNSFHCLIDGNYFHPVIMTDYGRNNTPVSIPYTCVEKGDNTYIPIACGSILAKVARDTYIMDMCALHPILKERYHLDTNMGYGTKPHMDAIKQYGPTQWHRKSFGICGTWTSAGCVEDVQKKDKKGMYNPYKKKQVGCLIVPDDDDV